MSRQPLYVRILRTTTSRRKLVVATHESETSAASARAQPSKRYRLRWLKRILSAIALFIAASYELRTSALQSWFFSFFAKDVSYTLRPGKSSEIAFPQGGPFDQIRGYTLIPQFVDRLTEAGYNITEQARMSTRLL